jgi:hypothetical protein
MKIPRRGSVRHARSASRPGRIARRNQLLVELPRTLLDASSVSESNGIEHVSATRGSLDSTTHEVLSRRAGASDPGELRPSERVNLPIEIRRADRRAFGDDLVGQCSRRAWLSGAPVMGAGSENNKTRRMKDAKEVRHASHG